MGPGQNAQLEETREGRRAQVAKLRMRRHRRGGEMTQSSEKLSFQATGGESGSPASLRAQRRQLAFLSGVACMLMSVTVAGGGKRKRTRKAASPLPGQCQPCSASRLRCPPHHGSPPLAAARAAAAAAATARARRAGRPAPARFPPPPPWARSRHRPPAECLGLPRPAPRETAPPGRRPPAAHNTAQHAQRAQQAGVGEEAG